MIAADNAAWTRSHYDAVIVGSGPNGLAAAITLARAGWSVLIIEARESAGGGLRSAELTRPGFVHDVCASVLAFGAVSPFFNALPVDQVPLKWTYPMLPAAHPLEDGQAAALFRCVEETADGLGNDSATYRRLFAPLTDGAAELFRQLLAPLHLPGRPGLIARFGITAIQSAERLARRFHSDEARALIAGMASHAGLPLDRPATAAVVLMLILSGHVGGWPLSVGGTGQMARQLIDYFKSLGGELHVNSTVKTLGDVPPSRVVLFDVVPRTLLRIAGDALPKAYRRRLERFRHGMGVYKVDWALDAPIPWRHEFCRQAGTVHVGGTLEEIAAAEKAPWQGMLPQRPFVLVTQPSLFDDSRAPPGKHTAWGYCRIPAYEDRFGTMTERIEDQLERFAPGFRDCILSRHITTPADWEAYNANYVAGDIAGGVMDWRQIVARPVLSRSPYATPNPRLFLCSASTPPGPGVHGMCGYHAAQAVMNRSTKRTSGWL